MMKSCSLLRANNRILRGFTTPKAFFSADAVKSPSELYTTMLKKTEQKQALSINDLKTLLLNCKNPVEDYRYAIKAVAHYEKYNYDFSAEICSLVIKVAVEGQKINPLVKLLTNPKNRIGSWLSNKPYLLLHNKLLSLNQASDALALIKVSQQKGLAYLINPQLMIDIVNVSNSSDDLQELLSLAENSFPAEKTLIDTIKTKQSELAANSPSA